MQEELEEERKRQVQATKNAKKASERMAELEALLESQRQESSRSLRRIEKKMNDLSIALEDERKSSVEYQQNAEQVCTLVVERTKKTRFQATQRAKQLRQTIDEREEEIARANSKARKLQRELDDKQEMIDALTRENSKLRATSRSVWLWC